MQKNEGSKVVKWILIAVSVLFAFVFLILPLYTVISVALRNGVGKYFQYITDKDTISAVKLTAKATLSALLVNTFFGLFAAWFLTMFRFKGKKVLTTLIDIPVTVSPVIAGLIFILVFGLSLIHILRPGLDMIENLTNVPVVGVVPYGHFMIDDEDSLSERFENKAVNVIDIAVVRFPRISNFTDFNVFECIDGVSVRYVNNVSEIGNPDMIILPGSKNTVADLLWMRENGIEAAVKKSKCPIFGICGGYQMLGEKITDTDGVENGGSVRGMGLLPMETEFKTEKTRTIVNGVFENMTGTLKSLNGTEFEGYEIHMGKSEFSVPCMTKLSNGKQDGISQGDVYGSYVHGIFDKLSLIHIFY